VPIRSGYQRKVGSRHFSPMYPSQCHVLFRWSYQPTPSLWTLPICTAQTRGQSTGLSHTLPPFPRTVPSLGVFL
jgi:hypothetical protein